LKAQGSHKQVKKAAKPARKRGLAVGRDWKVSRGDRIIARQRQCGTCQSEGSIEVKGRSYGYCTLKKKRFCDMSLWQDCRDYEEKGE